MLITLNVKMRCVHSRTVIYKSKLRDPPVVDDRVFILKTQVTQIDEFWGRAVGPISEKETKIICLKTNV